MRQFKSKSNLNVLIAGAGKIGTIRASVIKKLSPKSKLYVFDTNFKKATLLAKEVKGVVVRSLMQGLKDKNIDAVIVAVVNKYSKNISLLALKNKKHVLCEKPMGVNYKEAKEICLVAKKSKMKFKCGFNHRYHPSIKEAYRLCKEKEIGEILFIRGIYGHGGRRGYDKEWRAKKSLSGGGELLDQGCHLIDLCNWFFNFEDIKNIHGINKTMFWNMNVDDNAFVLCETKSGKVAQIHASWTQWKNLFRFEIYGTKGAIEINGLGKSYGTETLRLYKREGLGTVPKMIEKRFTGPDKSWESEWKDFVKSVKSNKLLISNERESLQVMKTIGELYSH